MKTVYVGLSGGVDSAVSAYLLKQQGYDVVGVFLKVWEPDFLPCTAQADKLDAMRVAAHLGVPFKTYDVEEVYKEQVVSYMLNEYKQGKTPNPDVMCNRAVKFGVFWKQAKADGADFIATGHYAQRIVNHDEYSLHVGNDASKDQSYFLWTLTQKDLSHALFPVGTLPKSKVREIAKEIQLPNATKKDSQGICFLGHVEMHEFLKRYIPVQKGEVLNDEGEVVGEHDGVAFYTLGQVFPNNTSKRTYVVAKDIQKNTVTISSSLNTSSVGRTRLPLNHCNWIREIPQEGATYYAQTRYHGECYPVTLDNDVAVSKQPLLAADGQSLVLFDTDKKECLGGGIIG